MSDESESVLESLFPEAISEVHSSIQPTDNKPKKIPAKTKLKTEIKLINLPLGRIKKIIKLDPDVNMASSEAVFLITKCTEFFVETLAKEAYSFTSKAKKKTVQKRDIDAAINGSESLIFLEGTMD